MSESKRVYRVVILVFKRTIIHESSNASSLTVLAYFMIDKLSTCAYLPAIRVNDQHQAIEVSNCVYTRGCMPGRSIFCIPEL